MTECIKPLTPISLPESMRAGDPGLTGSSASDTAATSTARTVCEYYRSVASCYTPCACDDRAVRERFSRMNKTISAYYMGQDSEYSYEGAGPCPLVCGAGSATAGPSWALALAFVVAAKLLL